MKNNRLEVKYKIPEKQDAKFDDAVKNLAELYGFSFLGSGIDLQTGVRDISFDKEQ